MTDPVFRQPGRARGDPSDPSLAPSQGGLPLTTTRSRLCKLCELEAFDDPALRTMIRSAFRTQFTRFGPAFPKGVEYRKYWEVAMTLRAFRELQILGEDRDLLGVGAGAEATLFWLTNHARRVFATDLYIDNAEWATQTPAQMLLDPAPFASCAWNPRRLVVQHMIALALHYEESSFDGVLSSSSIEHFGSRDDARRALEEMHRVLRPGGVAALSTEYRVSGSGSLPGTLMFTIEDLEFLWSGLFEPVDRIDLHLSEDTLRHVVDFDEAAADVTAHRAWRHYPHILLHYQHRVTWTSIHVALRKLL